MNYKELIEKAGISEAEFLAVTLNGLVVEHSFQVGQGKGDPNPVKFKNARFEFDLTVGQGLERMISSERINYQNKERHHKGESTAASVARLQATAANGPVIVKVKALNERIIGVVDVDKVVEKVDPLAFFKAAAAKGKLTPEMLRRIKEELEAEGTELVR